MSVSRSGRFLITGALAPSTISKYRIGVIKFLEWCEENGGDATSLEEVDELLADYVHDLYERNDDGTGRGKGLASQTLYGILKFMPQADGKLPIASASVHGWLKMHPSQSYPPLTWDLTVVLACHMTRHGLLRHAIGTLLAFDCFLRVGELVNLRRGDVSDTGDSRMGSEYRGMSVRLRTTKTGPNQWVQVDDAWVQTLLRKVVAATPGGINTRLFPWSAAQFRSVFKTSCADVGLASTYVPHSLRHGGATRWHLPGHPVESILLRGRWASTKSARRYIQAGRAMLISTAVPQEVGRVGQVLCRDVLLSLSLSLPQLH